MDLRSTIDNIRIDIERYLLIETGTVTPALSSMIIGIAFGFGLQAVIVHRIGSYLKDCRYPFFIRKFLGALHWCLRIWVIQCYGIQIDRDASIGKGFYIGHLSGIYIGRCSIGKICSVHQQTRIEDNVVVGDNVWIGGHSVIKAGVTIEDDVTISSGSSVTGDIKKGSLVMGNPLRVVMSRFDNSSLLVKKANVRI